MKWNLLKSVLVIQLMFSPQTFSQEKEDPFQKGVDKVAESAENNFEFSAPIETDKGTVEIKLKTGAVEEFEEQAQKQPAIVVTEDVKDKIPGIDWKPVEIEKGETLAYFTEPTPSKVKTIGKFLKERFDTKSLKIFLLGIASTSTYVSLGYWIGNDNYNLTTHLFSLAGAIAFSAFYRLIYKEVVIFLNKDFKTVIKFVRGKSEVEEAKDLPESNNLERLLKITLVSTVFFVASHYSSWSDNADNRETKEIVLTAIKADLFYSISSAFEILTARATDTRYKANLAKMDKKKAYEEAYFSMTKLSIGITFMHGLTMMFAERGYKVAFWSLVAGSVYVTFELFRTDIWRFLRRRDLGLWGLTRLLNKCGDLF